MSRTYREVLSDRKSGTEKARDGKTRKTMANWVARDNRATGLREHRQYRRKVKHQLRAGDHDVMSGKRRRYGDRYGAYFL